MGALAVDIPQIPALIYKVSIKTALAYTILFLIRVGIKFVVRKLLTNRKNNGANSPFYGTIITF